MKIITALTLSLVFLVFSVEAGKKKRCGTLVTANCETHDSQSCPNKPICGYKQVLLQENSGCCCHPKCSANEVYNCQCDDSICGQPDKVCFRCQNGCHCAEGFIRDVEGGKCVPAKTCPKEPLVCKGENEVVDCRCRQTVCGMMYPAVACLRCTEGCYCAEGYIRENIKGKGGKCITYEECSNSKN